MSAGERQQRSCCRSLRDTVTKRPALPRFPAEEQLLAEHNRAAQLSLANTATFPLHDVDWFCARPDCGPDQRKLAYPDAFARNTISFATSQQRSPRQVATIKNGGDRRDRTDDLMLAKHALSQLSYVPNRWGRSSRRQRHRGLEPAARRQRTPKSPRCGSHWWAWDDSNVRPHPYQGCALTT